MNSSVCSEEPIVEEEEMEPKQAPLPNAEGIKSFVAQSSSSFGRLVQGTFEFQTHAEAERLSAMLALNSTSPERASVGFWELLSNAIEHGNLGIDLDLKTRLLNEGKFEEEVARRHALPEYRNRTVTAEFRSEPDRTLLKVSDEGEGFDFEDILNREMSLDRPNGRGIKLAQQFGFDRLEYLGKGNVVEGCILGE
ncbi:ATP-binding protein [Roseibium sp.]|uniref:ATP-binding protein n=1 Tax=Roseibium sp. TaxID=1936156 RepID=UPI0039EF3747